jgi:hypothetical protein
MIMKKILLTLAISFGLIGVMPAMALAAPGLKLDKKDISSKQCNPEDAHAKQIVNVHFKLINDYDSGFNNGANAWANDTMNRELSVFKLSDGSYCAQVKDNGKFVTFAGQSPGATNTPISAGIKGDIDGGYVTTFFAGVFDPQLPTKGDLGTYDLECTDAYTCPGAPDRPSVFNTSYFSSTSGADLAQWGWVYHAGKHGTWLNQDDVTAQNSGDITN